MYKSIPLYAIWRSGHLLLETCPGWNPCWILLYRTLFLLQQERQRSWKGTMAVQHKPFLSFCLPALLSLLPLSAISAQASDLIVGNLVQDSVSRFDGTTGAFLGTLIPSNSGGLDGPAGLAIGPDGNLYVASQVTGDVRRYNLSTGAFIDVFTSGFTMNGPENIKFGPDGNLYASDLFNNSVERYNGTTGAFIDTFISAGSGGLAFPHDLLFAPDGSLFVSSGQNGAVYRYNAVTGAFLNDFISPGGGGLGSPYSMAFGADGNFYVSDYLTNSVKRYNGTTGAYIDDFVPRFSVFSPIDIQFGQDGNLYVAGLNSGGIFRYDPSGNPLGAFATTDTPYYFLFTPNATSVPEPGMLALLAGVAVFGGLAVRHRKQQ